MIHVSLYPLSHTLYTSFVYAGLYDLAASKEIDLSLSYIPRMDIQERNGPYESRNNNHIVFFKVTDRNRADQRLIAVDLMDNWGISSLSALEKCDIYFKRNYRRKEVQEHQPRLCHKVLPFGLWFAIRSGNEKNWFTRRLLAGIASRQLFRKPRLEVTKLSEDLERDRGASKTSKGWGYSLLRDIEIPADVPSEPKILFLTRAFDTDNKSPELTHDLNEQRAALIRAFREHFGKQFLGGLMPTAAAQSRYPDLLSPVPTDRDSYFRLVREHAIVMSTMGLVESIPGKIAELLAASRCILSDPFQFELPYTLGDDVNALFFDSVDQAIEKAESLVGDPARIRAMRAANAAFYENHVSPMATMRRCIENALKRE